MKWTFGQLIFLTALVILAGCLPKRALYFFSPNQNLRNLQHWQAPGSVRARYPDAPVLPAAPVRPDSLFFTASTDPEASIPKKFIQIPPTAAKAKVEPEKTAAFSRLIVKKITLQKASQKKVRNNAEGKRRLHLGAVISLLFSLFGCLTFLAAFTLAEPLTLLTLGLLSIFAALVTGAVGMSKIKKHPTRFSGKGLAIPGLVIGSIMLFIYMMSILFVIGYS
jgi:hypothetical protein